MMETRDMIIIGFGTIAAIFFLLFSIYCIIRGYDDTEDDNDEEESKFEEGDVVYKKGTTRTDPMVGPIPITIDEVLEDYRGRRYYSCYIGLNGVTDEDRKNTEPTIWRATKLENEYEKIE